MNFAENVNARLTPLYPRDKLSVLDYGEVGDTLLSKLEPRECVYQGVGQFTVSIEYVMRLRPDSLQERLPLPL